MNCRPVMHDTKFTRLAIKQLRDATKDEDPDERLQKMEELAYKVYEGLGDAIETLEKDQELNPKGFFGIALYPENLWSLFCIMVTIGLGHAQRNSEEQDI